jgi:hypothetical protein
MTHRDRSRAMDNTPSLANLFLFLKFSPYLYAGKASTLFASPFQEKGERLSAMPFSLPLPSRGTDAGVEWG